MACEHPIIIRNRRFAGQPYEKIVENLAIHPEDKYREFIQVPCGKCESCLKQERNDWFVRLNREFAYCKSVGFEVWFVTLTIAPRFYAQALEDPSAFLRRFFEKIRHSFGKSVKHAFFTEFSPTKGRMHFHGLFFGPHLTFKDLHGLSREFGWIWAQPAKSAACIRYITKYIVKDIQFCRKGGQLLDAKYRRKHVSAGVGSYLGTFPPPSFSRRTWVFRGANSNIEYCYRIPRYYDKFVSEETRRKKAIVGAFLSAQNLSDNLSSVSLLEIAKGVFSGSEFARTFSPESISNALLGMRLRVAYSATPACFFGWSNFDISPS